MNKQIRMRFIWNRKLGLTGPFIKRFFAQKKKKRKTNTMPARYLASE